MQLGDMLFQFAELEGKAFSWLHDVPMISVDGVFEHYDPLTDYALTFKAMLKYEVRMQGHKVYIGSMRNKSTVVNEHVNNPEKVAHAIIECILKHNNLWSK